ncbi:hypothetical protein RND71_040365 [Anisodus tanguticus]|uniref:Uncharacterized protein n=1 Tax=Anisodus tanguticus TaxID=243964 RepID=A0AAE1UNU4_9SOLA|nr:hypothetical protein RND71_040365 [Anisodus tanguticus]
MIVCVITALDRANAEGALLPLPKILDQVDIKTGIKPTVSKDIIGKQGEDEVTICMEDQLRSLGIISSDYDLSPSSILDHKILKGISVDASIPPKKIWKFISELHTSLTLQKASLYMDGVSLNTIWENESLHQLSSMGRHVLPWICCILVNRNEFVTSQEPLTPLLDSLNKVGYAATVLLLRNYGFTLGCQVVDLSCFLESRF